MKHLAAKMKLPIERIPMVLNEFGNAGGPSVPLAVTQGGLVRPKDRAIRLLMLGYGVGLSWSSALVGLDPSVPLIHSEWS